MTIGTLYFSPFREYHLNGWSDRIGRDNSLMCFDIGNMTVPVDKRSVVLGTCRLRLAQSFVFSFFANNVRTASLIAIGRGTDRCVSTSGKMMVPIRNRSVALGTCRLAQSSFLAFFANSVRTAGPIGVGEALIDMFRPRKDGGTC